LPAGTLPAALPGRWCWEWLGRHYNAVVSGLAAFAISVADEQQLGGCVPQASGRQGREEE